MGFMEDLGRSNSLSGVNGLLGKAIDIRRDDNQSQEKAYSLGLETQKLGMLKDEHELDMNKKKMEVKRLQEEEATEQFKTDVSTNPAIRSLPPEVQKDALEWGKKQGYWDENNIGSRRNQKRAFEEFKNNKETFNRFMWPAVQGKKSALEAANEELNTEMQKDSPNAEKIAKMKQRVQGLQKSYDLATDSYSKAQEHFDKLEEIKATNRTPDWSYIQDPDSSTGWSKYNSKTEEVVQHVAPPQSVVSGQNTDKRTASAERIARIRAANGGSGDRKTALIKNTEFLKGLGWDEKEAVTLLTSTKPMSKDAFIGQATLKIMNNDMIQDSDRADRVKEAIVLYESAIAKSGAKATSPRTPGASKQLTPNMAAEYLSKAKGDKNKARELAKKDGWQF